MANEVSQSLRQLRKGLEGEGRLTYSHVWLVIIIDPHRGEFPTQFLNSRDKSRLNGLILLEPLDSLA